MTSPGITHEEREFIAALDEATAEQSPVVTGADIARLLNAGWKLEPNACGCCDGWVWFREIDNSNFDIEIQTACVTKATHVALEMLNGSPTPETI